jgi:hypothetical protein
VKYTHKFEGAANDIFIQVGEQRETRERGKQREQREQRERRERRRERRMQFTSIDRGHVETYTERQR